MVLVCNQQGIFPRKNPRLLLVDVGATTFSGTVTFAGPTLPPVINADDTISGS
jgi:hypothetical protein